jgi:two-component system cell cycle response regulator CtrA
VIYWKKLEDVMCQAQSESLIRTGRLVVDLATRVVSVDDKPVRLTGKEYGILELLCQRKGTTLTKEMFLNHLYEGMNEPGLKIIDVFVCKLRKKLAQATGGKHYIETVWGRGYALRDPPAGTETTQGEPDHPGDMRFQASHQRTRGLTPHPAG